MVCLLSYISSQIWWVFSEVVTQNLQMPMYPNVCALGYVSVPFTDVDIFLTVIEVVNNRTKLQIFTHTHTHTFNGPFSGTTHVSRYQKGKTNLDFTEARGSQWQWNLLDHMQVCTSLQHPTAQFFTGRVPFLPPNQQCQSTEGTAYWVGICGYHWRSLKRLNSGKPWTQHLKGAIDLLTVATNSSNVLKFSRLLRFCATVPLLK